MGFCLLQGRGRLPRLRVCHAASAAQFVAMEVNKWQTNFTKRPRQPRRVPSLLPSLLLPLLLLWLQIMAHVCNSALLTNIYGGKKLSEITDLNHRFLILSSPNHAHDGQQADEFRGAPSSDNATQLDDGALAEQLPEASPLIASWKEQQQRSSRLVALTAAGPNAQQQNPSYDVASILSRQSVAAPLPSSSAAATSSSQLNAEPVVLESVSTEFPNPNINNLGHEITKILRKFFQHGYDKRVRPNYSGPPALVNVSFHIIGISSVDEVQMDFTTDFYFRQKWFDPRLEFDAVGEINELCVGAEFAERIWLPDTFFANEKTATFHRATTENTFIRIGQNGRVYRSIRLTVTCSCPMDLQYFPMDRQRCKIEIESYGYNTRDIDYRWERGNDSVSLNTKIELPQFKILGFKMGQEIQNLSSGDYIRLYCEIHFVRSMGYYLFQIYIPASLIVMISWVSFWLHRNATPARVALGVTTVLTMTTLMSSTNAALPKISYIKSIDVFLGTCFVMVFAALLEYASVGYIGKRIAMKRKRLQDLQQMQQHHQKVCVAAAASAAAAAAAAAAAVAQQKQHDSGLGNDSKTHSSASQEGQTLYRRSVGGLLKMMNEGTKTVHKSSVASTMMPASNNNNLTNINDHNGDLGAQFGAQDNRSSIKELVLRSGAYSTPRRNNIGFAPNASPLIVGPTSANDSRTPLLAAGAAIAAAAGNHHSNGATTEFEVNQTHDMIRICGLTPSAIDKHSRVVFPICFVCFNLMYWIIYGHISQQIEDRGPPLIPFLRN